MIALTIMVCLILQLE